MIVLDACLAWLIAAGIYYTVHAVGALLCRLITRNEDAYGQLRKTRGKSDGRAVFQRK